MEMSAHTSEHCTTRECENASDAKAATTNLVEESLELVLASGRDSESAHLDAGEAI